MFLQLRQAELPAKSFDQKPLAEVLSWIETHANVRLNVRWSDLEIEGIDMGMPVTLQARNMTAASALREVLQDAGQGMVDLDFVPSQEAIAVGPADALGDTAVTVTFDVTELVSDWPEEGRQKFRDDLISLLTTTIERDSWALNGGVTGTIDILNDQLVVHHRIDVLMEVARILDKLREG